jgi:UDP-N-acetylglucosamine diphosphorylase / glucose-1-phosphate thymidylyltransferase / UDP-N-acetylgalactosamine diphosphorylase / glucosamine-1-phosphate N-acetyltransferase / galactosamine-1-phosphate N-acetyltransferase
MAKEFAPERFFDFKTFAHKALFDRVKNVWEALGERLKDYIRNVLKPGIHGNVMDGAFIEDENLVFIGEDTVVEPGAYIKGPAIIGNNTQVRQGAYIRGDVIVGDRCVVGHTTEVKCAVMLDGAQAGHFAYIGDSILGNHVNLGAGAKLANLKMIKGNVIVRHKGKEIDTGLRKFGAIIGDHCELGCNSVTSPGTILSKNCIVYPCASIHGIFDENSIIKFRPTIEISKRIGN